MTDYLLLDLSDFETVNFLLPHLVERLGVQRTKDAIHQAIDLQLMNGNNETLPALFFETCGIALLSIDTLYHFTGISPYAEKMILLISKKNKSLQLIREI